MELISDMDGLPSASICSIWLINWNLEAANVNSPLHGHNTLHMSKVVFKVNVSICAEKSVNPPSAGF